MLRLLIISILLVAVKSEDDVSAVLGDWHPITTYPKRPAEPICEPFTITKADEKCNCGDKGEKPLVNFYNAVENSTVSVPITFIKETDEIFSSFVICTCNGKRSSLNLVKIINTDYFVMYENLYDDKIDENNYVVVVFVKKIPKISELEAVVNSVSDLRGKEPTYLWERNDLGEFE